MNPTVRVVAVRAGRLPGGRFQRRRRRRDRERTTTVGTQTKKNWPTLEKRRTINETNNDLLDTGGDTLRAVRRT